MQVVDVIGAGGKACEVNGPHGIPVSPGGSGGAADALSHSVIVFAGKNGRPIGRSPAVDGPGECQPGVVGEITERLVSRICGSMSGPRRRKAPENGPFQSIRPCRRVTT